MNHYRATALRIYELSLWWEDDAFALYSPVQRRHADSATYKCRQMGQILQTAVKYIHTFKSTQSPPRNPYVCLRAAIMGSFLLESQLDDALVNPKWAHLKEVFLQAMNYCAFSCAAIEYILRQFVTTEVVCLFNGQVLEDILISFQLHCM